MRINSKTPPTFDLVSLDEAKEHLRVTHTDEDTYIGSLIKAVCGYLDGYGGVLRRSIALQTYVLELDDLPRLLDIPLPPLVSVEAVKYLDVDRVEQVLSTDNYFVQNGDNGRILFEGALPSYAKLPGAIKIEFKAGYDEASIPQNIKHIVLILIAHWYENREVVVEGSRMEIPFSLEAMIESAKVPLL